MLRSKWKLCNVFSRSISVDNNYIMFSEKIFVKNISTIDSHLYPPAPGWPSGIVIIGSMEITIPGFNEIRSRSSIEMFSTNLDDSVNIFPQLETSFSAIVVRQDTEAVTVTKWSVFQESSLGEHLIELSSNVTTPDIINMIKHLGWPDDNKRLLLMNLTWHQVWSTQDPSHEPWHWSPSTWDWLHQHVCRTLSSPEQCNILEKDFRLWDMTWIATLNHRKAVEWENVSRSNLPEIISL